MQQLVPGTYGLLSKYRSFLRFSPLPCLKQSAVFRLSPSSTTHTLTFKRIAERVVRGLFGDRRI